MPDYDIAILGAGAAGGEIARAANRSGLKVAMIEQDTSLHPAEGAAPSPG